MTWKTFADQEQQLQQASQRRQEDVVVPQEQWGQIQPQQQQQAALPGIGVSYSPPSIDMMGATQDWWDLAGVGGQMPQFSAPRVSAPSVPPPEIPQTPEVTPGLYSGQLGEGPPTSPLEDLIDQIIGREPEAPPTPEVDEEWINNIISQYGMEPRSSEEIRDAAQAIAARQAFQKEQIVQREIDRFEREYPNEFRKAQQDIMAQADQMTADMQEETAARGMFYSSIMAGAASEIDSQTMQHINDIASQAASRVAGLRDERRDIQEWQILEEEVLFHQLEEQDRQQRQQLMHMHVEVATWADQMALDSWYRHETLQQQQDQLELQAIQLKQQEAERLGQHYASAMMADHPLVQGTLQDMGISPQQFGSMPMEAQSALVNQTVGFNEIEQQMRAREFQMRATVAEIQLQNANLQLQASIASGQFQMEAMGLNLQAMMHRDQQQLAWAGHALDVAGLEHQIGIDTARLGLEQQRLGLQARQTGQPEVDPFQYYMTAVDYWGQGHDYDVARQIAAQHPEALRMFESSVQSPTQQTPTQDTGGGFWDWLIDTPSDPLAQYGTGADVWDPLGR